jgi:hypothetical protein
VAEFRFNFVFLETAREDYLALSEANQATIDGLIDLIRVDPWIDPANHKYRFPTTVFDLIAYDDGVWPVMYHILDDSVVELWAVERADPNWPADINYRL